MKKFTARTWLVIFLLSGLVVSARWEPLAISARAQTKDQHVDFAEQYRQLVRLILRKEYVEAVVHGKRLIESTDEYLEAYRRIAQAAKEAQQLDLLKAYFLAVSQLTPDGPLPHYGLGLVYQELNEISAALAEFKLCLRLRPTFTAALKAALDLPRENAQEIEAILTELRAGAPESWVVPFGQGLYAARVNKPEEGLAHFDEALARNPEAAEVCYQKALLLGLRNRSAPALSALAACFPRLLPQLNEAQQIDVLYLSGSLAARLGNREQAEEQLQRAAQLAKAMGDEQYTGAYLANKAILNQQQGDYAAALLASQAALTLARKGTGRGAEILAGRNLVQAGRALYLLGDYQQARSYYAEGLSYAKKWKETSNEALINHYLGDLLAATGDYKQAVNHYRAAVALKRERADAESQHLTYTALVRLSLQTGDLSQAQAALQEMLRLGQESGDLRLGLNALAAQGELQMRLGRLEQALLSYTELLQQASPQGYAEFTWLAQAGLAQVYQRSQQYEKARAAYQEAIRVMENARARLNAPEDKAGFFQDKVEVYKNLIGVLLELASQPSPGDFKTEAFYYSERARARAFADLLAEAKVNVAQDLPADLAQQQQALQQHSSELTAKLFKEKALAVEKQNQPEIVRLEAELNKTDGALADWLRAVKARNPRYAALQYPEPVDLPQAQRLLDDRTLLLAYALGEQESYLFAVGRTQYQVARLPKAAELSAPVAQLLAALTGKEQSPDDYRASARALYRQLIEPAGKLLVGKTRLIVVPDGALHRLPFEVLMPAAKQHLVERYAINYAPSVSVLAGLQHERREADAAQRAFIAFADPVYDRQAAEKNNPVIAARLRAVDAGQQWKFQQLAHSRHEAEAIAKLFGKDQATLFLGAEAKEENVKIKDLLSQYRLVHFSAHGLVNESRPRFSGLVLSLPPVDSMTGSERAANTVEDGLLSAYEIFNLKLRADLVTLSACETALGKEVKGEGLMSLVRAFMYAGTPSVLASLWKVDDASAADLMVEFYRNWRQGMRVGKKLVRLNKAEALRQAQLKAIRNGSAPYYWAPFVLVGRAE